MGSGEVIIQGKHEMKNPLSITEIIRNYINIKKRDRKKPYAERRQRSTADISKNIETG